MKRRTFVLSALFAPFYVRAENGFNLRPRFDFKMLPATAAGSHAPLQMSDPIQVADEPCVAPPFGIQPPARFVQPMSENRLITPLRDAAKLGEPSQLLTRSAIAFYIARSPGLTQQKKDQFARDDGLVSPAGPPVIIDEAYANAIADLSVTGRRAYERFRLVQPKDETILALVKQKLGLEASTNPRLTAPAPLPNLSMNSGPRRPAAPQPRQAGGVADVNDCVKSALDRAYQVAHLLRGPAAQYASERKSLGWIAVSGEDDPPHRPVNMEPLPYPQYEVPVTVHGVTLQARFYVASANAPGAPAPPQFGPPKPGARLRGQLNQSILMPRSLPADEHPFVPQGHRVILFIHGHSSSAEEAAAIIPELLAAGKARGIYYSVITFDLPNNGYSQKFDHLAVPGLQSSGTSYPGGIFDNGNITTPVLDFVEDYIVAFVDAVDRVTPIKNRFAGVIGGSLGGNMGLRLGRRNPTAFPWLRNGIVSWSPASVWSPMVKDELKRHAPEHCLDKWNESEMPASRMNYFSEVYDGAMYDGHGGKQNFDAFLQSVFGGGHTQPDMWWSSKWKCKQGSIQQSRISRHEIYHEHFRRWHWRVAGEQLIFSQIAQVRFDQSESPANPYRYLQNRIPLLLASGEDDDYPYTGIYSATRSMAQKMANTPGFTLFLKNTGHSIHDERPRFLAGKITEFLG